MNTLVVPPLSLFVLAAVGLLLARWRRRTGIAVMAASAVLLVLLSTPLVSGALRRSLERAEPLAAADLERPAQAIVVLGGDLETRAPEYGGVTVGALTLERVRYAAWLQRRSGEPLLTTGGSLREGTPPLATLMADVLREEMGASVRWVESRARNTWENAERSAAMLEADGVTRIHLVTHAWHMPRARRCFEELGLEVVPAPTGFRAGPRAVLGELLPSSRALRESALALHEWIGLAWYGMRHY